MMTLINQVQYLMHKCKEFADVIVGEYNLQDPRACCFCMIHNEATIFNELLHAYVRMYNEQTQDGLLLVAGGLGLTHSQLKKQLRDKTNLVLKGLFVQVVSKIEYSIRETIRLYPAHKLMEYIDRKEKLLNSFDQVYDELDQETKDKLRKFKKKLRDVPPYDSFKLIIQASRKIGIIDEDVEKIWDCIIRIRNCTVHNNSIPSRDDKINIDGRVFQFRENQMIEDRLDFYLFFSTKAVKLFFSWAKTINQDI